MRGDVHFSIARAPTSVDSTSNETDASHEIESVRKTIYYVPFVAFNVTSNNRSSGDARKTGGKNETTPR